MNKNAFLSEILAKLCENMRTFRNYAKAFKLRDFKRKLSNYAILIGSVGLSAVKENYNNAHRFVCTLSKATIPAFTKANNGQTMPISPNFA